MPLELFDYQKLAVELYEEKTDLGIMSGIQSIPTGGGKTLIASEIVRRSGRRAVMLVHRNELALQARDGMRVLNSGLSMGIVKAEQDELGRDITIASIQTLLSKPRLDRFVASLSDDITLIADESHHMVSDSWMRVVQAIPHHTLVGLTATAHRADGRALGQLFEDIYHHIPMVELMAKGYLCRLVGVRVESQVNLDMVKIDRRTGDFVQRQLSEAVDTPENNRLVVQAYLDHCEGKRDRTVIFCQSVIHAENIARGLEKEGIAAGCVFGKTPEEERAFLLRWFREGKLPVISNVNVLTEGYDEPRINAIILASPTKSLGKFIQMVGRGARTFTGKEDCLIIDVSYNTDRHSLVTLPTLAGIMPDGSQSKKVGEQSRKEGEQIDFLDLAIDANPGLVDIADPSVVADRVHREVNLLNPKSNYFWHEVDGFWVCNAEGKYITLVQSEQGWKPYVVVSAKGIKPYAEPLFEHAVQDVSLAMSLGESRVPLPAYSQKNASWRTADNPPSQKQLQAAASWGIRGADKMTTSELSGKITESIFRSVVKKVTF